MPVVLLQSLITAASLLRLLIPSYSVFATQELSLGKTPEQPRTSMNPATIPNLSCPPTLGRQAQWPLVLHPAYYYCLCSMLDVLRQRISQRTRPPTRAAVPTPQR